MPAKNPRLRFLASRITREVYHLNDRVVIWRGHFCGESGVVVESVGKKLHVRLDDPSEKNRRLTTDGVVSVFITSCCLIA
jgi:hypothetical protein